MKANETAAPEVLPEPKVLPKVKPKVKPTRRIRPEKDDPFAVPGPKVNPSPKAGNLKTEIMNKLIISDIEMFTKLFKRNPNIVEFSREYTLKEGMVTRALAESVNIMLKKTDRTMHMFQAYNELNNFKKD